MSLLYWVDNIVKAVYRLSDGLDLETCLIQGLQDLATATKAGFPKEGVLVLLPQVDLSRGGININVTYHQVAAWL